MRPKLPIPGPRQGTRRRLARGALRLAVAGSVPEQQAEPDPRDHHEDHDEVERPPDTRDVDHPEQLIEELDDRGDRQADATDEVRAGGVSL